VRAALISAIVLAGACSDSVVSSVDVNTSGIFASYRISASSTGTTAAASFQVGDSGGAYLELAGGDAIAADGTSLALDPSGAALGQVLYTASVPAAQHHSFTFSRPGESSIANTVDAPAAFQLTSGPFDGDAGLEATLTWTPELTGASVTIEAKGMSSGCNGEDLVIAKDAPDVGSFAFSAADLIHWDGGMTPDCTFRVAVTRGSTASSSAVPRFAGLQLTSEQVESTTVHVHP
jgi:hypothetical protein